MLAAKLFRRYEVSTGSRPDLAIGVCTSRAMSCAAVFHTAFSRASDFATHSAIVTLAIRVTACVYVARYFSFGTSSIASLIPKAEIPKNPINISTGPVPGHVVTAQYPKDGSLFKRSIAIVKCKVNVAGIVNNAAIEIMRNFREIIKCTPLL